MGTHLEPSDFREELERDMLVPTEEIRLSDEF